MENRKNVARNLGLTRAESQAYYERGLQAFAKGDLENAVLDLSEAIHYDRARAELYSARGYIHLQAGNLDDSETDLRYALRLNKRQWLAQLALGIMDFNRGRWEEALQSFKKAQQAAPGRPEPWFYGALTQYKLGDLQKAATEMQIAVRWLGDNDKRRAEANRWLREFKGDPKK
jgi:tetratricopeptide (TPR) repeat protein